jgi:hypothetical protein
MIFQIKQILITIFVICLPLNTAEVLACMCANLSAKEAIENSTAVFTGKVVSFEYRKGIPNEFMDTLAKEKGEKVEYETMVVKIQVNQWWKGNVSKEVFLITNTVRTAYSSSIPGCDYNFKEGESYLVYAAGDKDELKTNACMRTRKLAAAAEDLAVLGEGKEPVKERDEPDKLLDARRKHVPVKLYAARDCAVSNVGFNKKAGSF